MYAFWKIVLVERQHHYLDHTVVWLALIIVLEPVVFLVLCMTC